MSITSGPGSASTSGGGAAGENAPAEDISGERVLAGDVAGERVLAVDIGGGRIAAALVDAQGRVGERAEVPTPAEEGGEAVLKAALELATSLVGNVRPSRVGIAVAGATDAVPGAGQHAPGVLPGWAGTELTGAFAAEFDVPAVALGAVQAQALGEARRGAGSRARSVLLVSVCAEIGGAYVLDGQVVTGAHGVAGQVGHLPVAEAAGQACACGGTGHLQSLASGAGILAAYRSAVLARGAAGRPEYEVSDTREIARKAREYSAAGELCQSVLTRSGYVLGRALGTLLNLLDPEVVVLAGGVPQQNGQSWSSGVSAGIAREALPAVADTKIAVARLGDDATLIGAAAYARERTHSAG